MLAAARIRLIVWCKARGHHVEPDRSSPKWRDDTAPRLPFPIGVGGLSVRVAGAAEGVSPLGGATKSIYHPFYATCIRVDGADRRHPHADPVGRTA